MNTETYRNPIAEHGADPFILYDHGTYYLYATTHVLWGYSVRTSPDLITWEDRGLCLTCGDAFCQPTLTCGFWAPEVWRAGGRFVMVYTVNEHIGIAFADSPLGPFVSEKKEPLVEHAAIDATLFTDGDGQTYLFYVGWGQVPYGIYGRRIDLDTLALGEETPILFPEDGSWETREGRVTEGPFILKHGGTYYLSYSGNGYESRQYAVGYATSPSPLGPYVRYAGNPILHQVPEKGIYGTGHHSFFTAANGELMIAYHRHYSAESVHDRTACIDRAVFVPDTPCDRLEILGPTAEDMPLPVPGNRFET